jgi:FkbM family methyltransferase
MSRSQLLETAGFNQLAAAKDGYLLYNRNDAYIGRSVQKYGEFSALEMELFKQVCGPGNVVIEAGANIGSHTVGLAHLVGSEGRVLAFEPQRLVFQTLCANVALNSLTNVDCYWAALGSQEGLVTVPEVDPHRYSNFGGLTLVGAQKGMQISCFTLDRFVALPRVTLIKIDVEGMEAEVLRGGEQILKRFKPLLYVENDRLDLSEALIRLIAGFGYRLFWHLPSLFNPNNFYGDDEDCYPGIGSINMLCVHRDAGVHIEYLQEVDDPSFHPLRP